MKNVNIEFNGETLNLTEAKNFSAVISGIKRANKDTDKILNVLSIVAVAYCDNEQAGTANHTKLNQLYTLLLGAENYETVRAKRLRAYVRECLGGIKFDTSSKKFVWADTGKDAAAKRVFRKGVKNIGFMVWCPPADAPKAEKTPKFITLAQLEKLAEKVTGQLELIGKDSTLEADEKAEQTRDIERALILAAVAVFGGKDGLTAAVEQFTAEKVDNAEGENESTMPETNTGKVRKLAAAENVSEAKAS